MNDPTPILDALLETAARFDEETIPVGDPYYIPSYAADFMDAAWPGWRENPAFCVFEVRTL